MTVFDCDAGKIATVAVAGWNALDPEGRATVAAAVRDRGGYFLEVELADDDGTCSVRIAGVVVASVASWRLLKTPAMPPADA